MFDQALHAAQGLGHGEQAQRLEERARRRQAALDHEREHPAEALHLLARQRVLRVLRQAGPGQALDLGMAAQRFRDQACILIVPLHADVQRLQAAKHQERIERSGHRADRVLQKRELLVQIVAAQHQGAGHHVAVAVQVFRHRVRHDVEAELQRALEEGRGEGVVAD